MSLANPSSSHPPARTMIFIDGGYLRKCTEELWKLKIEDFYFYEFSVYLAEKAFKKLEYAQIIRTYFYDGIVEATDKNFPSQKKFHNNIISSNRNHEVRSGQLIKIEKERYRQKGVDVLMAIDMIDKANSNQYDVAIIVAGDLDHLEAIKTIRNKGKQVFGVFYKKSIAQELLLNVDDHYELEKTDLKGIKNMKLPR